MSDKVRIGINGLGRIGRTILRELYNRNVQDLEIVAVNNLGDPENLAYLLKYDSLHGIHPGQISYSENSLEISGRKIPFSNCSDPAEIPWEKREVDIVIDATGVFQDKQSLGKHLRGSVKHVILCAPGKDVDGTFVMGINNTDFDPSRHKIVSNASCTTNCLTPLIKVIDNEWGVENGFMTTVHSYTSDQRLLDSLHSDWRRSRSAALSMIPTTTGAARAVGLVLPEMKGKLDGIAIRVPTANVSVVDLVVNLKKNTDKKDVNAAMKEAAGGELKGILSYTEEPLVSQDFRGNRASSIFDAPLTNVINRGLKVVSWYDNEVGFSNRVIDLALYMGGK
ncbi:MAG: type I glyceraldehyde-3-phosphate dehydrogenase [Halobacteriovoraceae bacterium]|nr:type I glyceraldehyde-3-phosphate dehydrogenase [Halobacteriovoraceae bacterium]